MLTLISKACWAVLLVVVFFIAYALAEQANALLIAEAEEAFIPMCLSSCCFLLGVFILTEIIFGD